MNDPILLVDDEEGIRRIMGISLMDAGYTVYTAASAEEAIDIFDNLRPSIILTDIKMPGMDGIELLQRLKAKDPDTEIIMITGHGDIDLAIRSLKYEATDFITKPIHDEVLQVALKRAQERISLKQQLKEYTESLEEMVAQKSRQLVEAERLAAVGETVAGLSHTIKNIAGGLKGGSFVLEKGIELNNSQYLQEGWEMIQGNVEKITRLSLNLLNYAKPDQPDFHSINPNIPLKEVFSLIQPQAQKYSINITLIICEELPPIQIDSDAIQNALLNLATNAVDAVVGEEATSDWSPQIDLSVQKITGWGIEYIIKDNGKGIDETIKSKLFQRFISTKGSKGTGIGLMLTKKIVDQHGGKISVSSQKGLGTCFKIQLPNT
ncbi:MAG: response regulator [Desulfobacteraceae bacterium]